MLTQTNKKTAPADGLPKPHPAYSKLQDRFTSHFHDIFLNDMAEKTVVIIPSLTMDKEILQTVKGVEHYEERMLSMLMLLRMPRTRVIYVTSMPIDGSIVDYYLHLLPGITGYHAMQRLTLLSCYDASPKPLTEKLLERPRLLKRIKEQIRYPELAHLAFFNVTEIERKLALELDIPIFGCDPSLLYLGSKSGCRHIFKKLGIPLPVGMESLESLQDICTALAQLKKNNPDLRKAVLKINDGFSGEGNAIYCYHQLDAHHDQLAAKIQHSLKENLKIVAPKLSFQEYLQKFTDMGGIAEEFLEGEIKESPSVQCRINPVGEPEIVSTHSQIMSGESDQVFLGCSFPAKIEYNREIAQMGKKISDELQREGVLGRFSIDFISIKKPEGWEHYAIEINLRKGGTTHPYVLLEFLTEGEYDWQKGEFLMPNGQTRSYFASDNVVNENYIGLTPHDLIDIATCNRLQYDGARQSGVMFHMIGGLSQYGKLGMVCIGRTVEEAKELYDKTLAILDKESSH